MKNTTKTPFEMGDVKCQVQNSILNYFLSVYTSACTIYRMYWYMFKQNRILFLASLVGLGQRRTYFWGQHCQSVSLYVELSQSWQIPNFLGQSHQIILSQTQLETYIYNKCLYKEKSLSLSFTLSLKHISHLYFILDSYAVPTNLYKHILYKCVKNMNNNKEKYITCISMITLLILS